MKTTIVLLTTVVVMACSAAGEPVGPGRENTAGGSGDPTSQSSGDTGQASATPLPCDVASVFADQCWACHGARTTNAAPMSLVTWEDVAAEALLNPGASVAQRIAERISDPANPMPPPAMGSLSEGQRTVLTAWLGAGAPPGDGSYCAMADPSQPPPGSAPGAGGATSTGGTGSVSAGGTAGAGGAPVNPPPVDGSCTPYRFLARQSAADDPFHVPVRPEVYQCFYFTVPWDEPVQGFSFQPIIDNDQVLHHWLLYKVDVPQPDGLNVECLGTHPDSELIAGWAPGAPGYNLPPEAGLELPPPGSTVMVEIHYFNATLAADQVDRSGVEICASPNFRPQTATVSWLGTEAIIIPPAQEMVIPSTCTPQAEEPITILRSWPHMHTYGVAFNSTINRADGTTETLLDVPNYDFYNQYSYNTPAVIQPGDTITSTCVYRNTTAGIVTFGESTTQEMCYNFVWAYPARSLISTGVLHRNQCLF